MKFVFTNNDGVSYTISEEGLESVKNLETTVATGGLYLWDGADFHQINISNSFKPESLALIKGSPVNNLTFYEGQVMPLILSKDVEFIDETSVRVTHTYADDISVEYTYTQVDPDLTIDVRIINNSTGVQITCPAIGGLYWTFDQVPTGIAFRYDEADTNKLHPSNNTPVYCGYLRDSQFGVSLTSTGLFNERSLVHFDYKDASAPNALQVRALEHYLRRTVWPGAEETYQLVLRVSRTLTQEHLLETYKEDILATYGDRLYSISDRRWLQGFELADFDEDNTNPFKYNSTRIDVGLNALFSIAAPITTSCGVTGRGAVFYNVGGSFAADDARFPLYTWRGGTHRAEFDVWPNASKDNMLGVVQTAMANGSLEMGLLAEVHFTNTRLNWTTDEMETALWPKSDTASDTIVFEAHNWNLIRYRLNRVGHYGFNIYFCPNSGTGFECAILAPRLREYFGNDVSIYYGHGIDLVAPFVGFHTTANYTTAGGWEYTTPLWFFELMRWVYDDIDVYAQLGTVEGTPTETSFEYGLRNRISGWTTVSAENSVVAAIQPTYINSGTGQFI